MLCPLCQKRKKNQKNTKNSKFFDIFQFSFVNTMKRKKYLTSYCFSLGVNMTNETNEKYSWDSEKRELIIRTRGLDFVELADLIFADPGMVTEPDNRGNYGELRYLSFALVRDMRLCLCFTWRGGRIHLITIFKMREKKWRKYYGNKC